LPKPKRRTSGAGDLIEREITSKLKDYSDEERLTLENALREKLFRKYNAKFLLKEIAPVAQNISADDDPGARQNKRAGHNRDVH
jgi:hypothetical protein